jgi:glycosyltransferase involved in cell wall biosynthesis
MQFSVVITVFERDQIFLPRAVSCLMNQTFRDFEVVVVVDGDTPLEQYEPNRIFGGKLPVRVVYLPRSSTIGFRERHHSLELVHGEYVAWLNVDNLVYPNWLQNHFTNIRDCRGSISVVNIQYWLKHDYWGVLPKALAYGELDLLNFALPTALAREEKVFGPTEEHIPYADWLAFERCTKKAPVIWDRNQSICACHF